MKKLALASITLLGLATLPAHAVTAYASNNATGNQGWGGALGMDFNVNSAIDVTSLGAFDDGQDGFAGTIQVAVFDRQSGVQVGPSAAFSGTAQALQGLDRFAAVTPFTLAPGQYSIVAVGFSNADRNWNNDFGGTPSTMDSGGGLISFVGGARYSFNMGVLALPTVIDGGPVNRYNAGTFQFTAAVPEASTYAMMLAGLAAMGLLARRRRAD